MTNQPKKNWKPRPKQPKCPCCGKSLYKGLPPSTPGKYKSVKKTDPYKFCRNEECMAFGDITEHGYEAIDGSEPVSKQEAKRPSSSKAKSKPSTKVPEGVKTVAEQPIEAEPEDTEAEPEDTEAEAPRPLCQICGRVECICDQLGDGSESEQVRQARDRIKRALIQDGDYTHNLIGLVLTMLAQELGNNGIANQLIDDYNLSDRYGIHKRD